MTIETKKIVDQGRLEFSKNSHKATWWKRLIRVSCQFHENKTLVDADLLTAKSLLEFP